MSGRADVVGVILAGGRGSRIGGADKAFLELGGKTLIARAIERARPQVGELAINANGDPRRFAAFGLPVIPDRIEGFLGPLAGILSALEWMRVNRPEARWLASFACDCPFFPRHLVERLIAAAEREKVSVAIAANAERHHPVFAVWHADLAVSSEGVLGSQGLRKMDDFVALFTSVRVEFSASTADPFLNINTQDDLERAEALVASARPL